MDLLAAALYGYAPFLNPKAITPLAVIAIVTRIAKLAVCCNRRVPSISKSQIQGQYHKHSYRHEEDKFPFGRKMAEGLVVSKSRKRLLKLS